MSSYWKMVFAIVAELCFFLVSLETAQVRIQIEIPVNINDDDWRPNIRDGSILFSPVNQITTAEAAPIVINSRMYVTAGNLVLAISADTGKELLRYPAGPESSASRLQLRSRFRTEVEAVATTWQVPSRNSPHFLTKMEQTNTRRT